MATEDLLPTYLKEIFDRAIPDPLSGNEPLQSFSAPLDTVTLSDVLAAQTARRPALYGVGKYGDCDYQSRADSTFSGRVLTDAYRSLGLDGDGLAVPGGLGVWEGTTNLCTNGGFESNTTGWTTQNGATLTRDATQVKFGTQAARLVKPGSSAYEGAVFSSVAVTNGLAYTISAWIYGAAGDAYILAAANTNIAATGTLGVTGWNRVSASGTATSTASGNITIEGTATPAATTWWIDGVQFEQKSIATPYVETNGAAVSRTGARIQIPVEYGGTPLLNATQMWLATSHQMGFPSSTNVGDRFVLSWMDDSSHMVQFMWHGGANTWRITRANPTNGTSWDSAADSFSTGTYRTVVFAVTAATHAISVNGGAFSSGGVPFPPVIAATLADLGNSPLQGSNLQIDSSMLWAAFGTGVLTSADLAYLNSVSTSPPLFSGLSSSAYCTGIVLGNVATPILLLGP